MLHHHGGISWETYYQWPVAYKEWYLERLKKELETQNNGSNPDVAKGTNTPQRNINFAQLQKRLGLE